MEEIKDENLNSEIEEGDQAPDDETLESDIESEDISEDDDADAIREKYVKTQELNKQLFARAKKAEGFVLKDGKWVKKSAEKPKEQPKQEKSKKEEPVDIEAKLNERFEQRDLEEMDLPDSIKSEVQKLAKLQGLSVKKAANDPYILHLKENYEETRKTEEATISRTNKKGGKTTFSLDEPPEVDMSTEEGRKVYDEWFKWRVKQG